MGAGASSIRPIGWESVSGLTVCCIESIVKAGCSFSFYMSVERWCREGFVFNRITGLHHG
jgi:hypothetical protein